MSQPSTPLNQKIVPMRGAAKKASAIFEKQLLSSPDEHRSIPFGEPSRTERKVIKTYASKGRLIADRDTTRTKKLSGRKRPLTHGSDDSDGPVSEPATPLSSPRSYKSSPIRSKSSRQNIGTSSPFPALSRRANARAVTPPPSVRAKKMASEKWELTSLDSFVWVLINQRGRLVDKEALDDQDDQMWWPGKISSKNVFCQPLCVTLIGKLSNEFASTVEIPSPSEHNILPLLTPDTNLRFDPTTFRLARTVDQVTESPRKRRKKGDPAQGTAAIELKWRASVSKMMDEHEKDNDGLPSVGLAYSDDLYGSARNVDSWLPPKVASKVTKGKQTRASTPEPEPSDRWTPPPPDPTLDVPGELVLAREPKGTHYWPAMLEEYIPPLKPTQKAKYKVRFLDESTYAVPRDTFFTSDEEGFATCKLGEWESSYKDVVNDEDNADDNELNDPKRGPSPLPTIPVPTEFCDLTMAEQFTYTKPVLVAILHCEYPPAKDRHDNFIRGGTARKTVTDNACERGVIVPEDIDKLQGHLLWWALRDERRAKRLDDGDASPGEVEALPGPSVDLDQLEVEMKSDIATAGNSDGAVVSSPTEPGPPPSSVPTEFEPMNLEPPSSPLTPKDSGNVSEKITSDVLPLDPVPTESYCPPPRQQGCEAYEALSGVEKLEYCSNVLLPEAILQLLLWRSGERQSLDLLPPEEETRLHQLAQLKSHETDWVRDVMRLREVTVRAQRRLSNTGVVTSRSRSGRKSNGRG